jgi:hypothetical protein
LTTIGCAGARSGNVEVWFMGANYPYDLAVDSRYLTVPVVVLEAPDVPSHHSKYCYETYTPVFHPRISQCRSIGQIPRNPAFLSQFITCTTATWTIRTGDSKPSFQR